VLLLGLAQNVLDALESRGDGGEIGGLARGGQGFSAGNRIAHIFGAGGQHGADHVVRKAAHILQVEAQTFAQEGRNLLFIGSIDAARSNHIGQSQRQARLGQYLDNGIGRAAQCERVFRAGRRVADAEHRGNRLNSVGKAEQLALDGGGNCVVGGGRRVLRVDGLRDGLAEPLSFCIESADHSL
jgi:hypothetical protein